MLLVRIMYVYQYIYQQQAWNRISGVARITIISGVQSDDKITILYLIMQTGQKLPYTIRQEPQQTSMRVPTYNFSFHWWLTRILHQM